MRRLPPRNEGPPTALRFALVLFVVVGGIAGAIRYAARETPKADPAAPKWKLDR